MKRFFPISICAAVLAFTAATATAEQSLDRIVAVVNEDVILMSELKAQTDLLRQRMQGSTRLPPEDVLREQVLDRMIDTKLKLTMADRIGTKVSDDQLNQALQRIAEQNNTTLQNLPELLAKEGIDYKTYREEMREQMIIRQTESQHLRDNVSITEDQVERYLTNEATGIDKDSRYHLRHILIALPSEPESGQLEKARKKIEGIRDELSEGADFAELAITHSDGQKSLDGGDLGWMQAGEVPSIFNKAVQSLDTGEVSDPIRSSYGYHLIKLEDAERGDPVMVREARIRHILMKPDAIMDEEKVREKLRSLRTRIREGEDFAEIARQHSDDHQSAADGGVIDWQPLQRFAPDFRAKLENLEPGMISDPFRTRYGWHIAEVLEFRESDQTNEVRRRQAIQALRQKQMQEERELWVRQLRNRAYIDIRL